MEDEELGALSTVTDAESEAMPGMTGNPQALAVLNSIRAEQKKRYDEYAARLRAARAAQQAPAQSNMSRLASALLAAGAPNAARSNWAALQQGVQNWNQTGAAQEAEALKQKQLAAAEEAELAKSAFEQGASMETLAAKYALAPQKQAAPRAPLVVNDPIRGSVVMHPFAANVPLGRGDVVQANGDVMKADGTLVPMAEYVRGAPGRPMQVAEAPATQTRPETPATPAAPTAKDWRAFEPGAVVNGPQIGEMPGTRWMITSAGPKLQQGLSPGQVSADNTFAKEAQDWRAQGGYTNTLENLESLASALQNLDTENVSGIDAGGFLNKGLFGVVNPTGKATQDTVERVIQKSLREVLGAQYTATEGADLLARTYDPKLPEHINRERVVRLVKAIRDAAKAKEAAAIYFEKNGTLAGYNGPAPINWNRLKSAVLDDRAQAELQRRRAGEPASADVREPKPSGNRPIPQNLLEQYRKVPAANRATAKERLRAAGYDISGLK